MAEDSGRAELDIQEILKRVNSDTNGPSERGARVLAYLKKGDFSSWDVLCFAAEYIASQSLVLTWLTGDARSLIRSIYVAHYFRFQEHQWLDKKENPDDVQRGRADSGATESEG